MEAAIFLGVGIELVDSPVLGMLEDIFFAEKHLNSGVEKWHFYHVGMHALGGLQVVRRISRRRLFCSRSSVL